MKTTVKSERHLPAIRSLLGPLSSRMPEERVRGIPTTLPCCSWCDQPLPFGRAEAILVEIGKAIRDVQTDKFDRFLRPDLDADVCSVCDQAIPPDKVQEIMARVVEMLPKQKQRLAEATEHLEDTAEALMGPRKKHLPGAA